MLELGKQNATAIYPTRDIIRTDGKIVHSHHAKPGDCLQHNLVGRAGRSLSCCVIWVLDFWLSIHKLLAFAWPYVLDQLYYSIWMRRNQRPLNRNFMGNLLTIFLSSLLLSLIATEAQKKWRKNCLCNKRSHFFDILPALLRKDCIQVQTSFDVNGPNLQVNNFPRSLCYYP